MLHLVSEAVASATLVCCSTLLCKALPFSIVHPSVFQRPETYSHPCHAPFHSCLCFTLPMFPTADTTSNSAPFFIPHYVSCPFLVPYPSLCYFSNTPNHAYLSLQPTTQHLDYYDVVCLPFLTNLTPVRFIAFFPPEPSCFFFFVRLHIYSYSYITNYIIVI